MDPEILRALQDGHDPADIAAEMGRRGLEVPMYLQQMAATKPQGFADYVNANDTPPPPSDPSTLALAAGAAATGLGSAASAHPYLAALGVGTGGTLAAERATRGARAASRVNSILEGSGGVQGLRNTLDQYVAAGRGNLVTLADLSDAARNQADFVATNNPDVRAALAKIHQARQLGVPQRVGDDIRGLAVAGDAVPRTEMLQNRAAQIAFGKSDEGFEGLRRANPVIEDPAGFVEALGLDNPAAKPEMRPLRDAFQKVQAKFASAGAGAPPPPSFSTLQQMDRDIQARIGAAYQAGNVPLAGELKDARDRLFDVMDHQFGNGKYSDIIGKYRAFSQHNELTQAGLDFWSQPQQVEDISARVNSMTPAELDVFRRGVTGGYRTLVDNALKGDNVARQSLKASGATTAKMNVIFGNKATFDRYMGRLHLEDELAKLGTVGTGSQTASRVSEMEAEAPPISGAQAAEAVASPKHALLRFLGEKVFQPARVYARGTAQELAPMFRQQGADAISQLLSKLETAR